MAKFCGGGNSKPFILKEHEKKKVLFMFTDILEDRNEEKFVEFKIDYGTTREDMGQMFLYIELWRFEQLLKQFKEVKEKECEP